jgi:hypothetical protein
LLRLKAHLREPLLKEENRTADEHRLTQIIKELHPKGKVGTTDFTDFEEVCAKLLLIQKVTENSAI